MSVPDQTLPVERLVSSLIAYDQVVELSAGGEEVLATGVAVRPNDVVAEQRRPGPMHVVDVARALGIPRERVSGLIEASPGERVNAGQVLARRGGLRQKAVQSPVEGTVVHVDPAGYVLIRGLPQSHSLRALIQGEVGAITSGERVLIRGRGALVEGCWGNGASDHGLLRMIVRSRDEIPDGTLIDVAMQGTVLVVGAAMDAAMLAGARRFGVRGLIAGGLDHALLEIAREMPYPILVTEGFGSRPINRRAFAVLAAQEGREVSLVTSFKQRRPLLFAPRTEAAPNREQPAPLAEGDTVRLVTPPHAGKSGRVRSLDVGRIQLPSGLESPGCEIELDSGSTVRVPLTNLERLVG